MYGKLLMHEAQPERAGEFADSSGSKVIYTCGETKNKN
jgi:hypothetical protein